MELPEELSRSGSIGFGKIIGIANTIKLPDYARDKALDLFSEAKKKHLLRGRGTKTVASACLYIACRIHKEPWTIKDIAEESEVSAKNVRKASKALLPELKIKLFPVDPSVVISYFCSELNLSNKVESKAEEILKEATETGLTNRASPEGIAAGIVYIAAILEGEHRTQDEMSKTIGVTEVTIRTRYKKIAKKLDIDMLL